MTTKDIRVKKIVKPKIRFQGFLDNPISRFRFDEIFEFSTGRNIKQKQSSPDFEIPCVRYGELYHLYNEVILKVINKTNLPADELVFSNGDEILLPSAGEDPMDIGCASALTIRNVAIGRTINVLSPKHEGIYSHTYASYYINAVLRKKISTLARGSSISNVYNSDLKTLVMYCPSFEEQEKIADFLMAIDGKLEQLTRKHDLLTKYKKGCMEKIFSREIRFKDNNGNDFPDWEWKTLSTVGERITNKNTNFEYKSVLTNSATQGVVLQSDYFDSDVAKAGNIDSYYIVKKGDFVYNPRISTTAPVGPIKRNNITDGVMSPLYTIFRLNGESGAFYEQFFTSTLWHKYMKSVANFGARHDRMAIATKDFLSLPLPCPDTDEQQKIVSFLSSIDRKVTLATKELETAKVFKSGLLQNMFV